MYKLNKTAGTYLHFIVLVFVEQVLSWLEVVKVTREKKRIEWGTKYKHSFQNSRLHQSRLCVYGLNQSWVCVYGVVVHLHSVKGPDVRVVDGLTMMKVQRVHLFHLNLQRNNKILINKQNARMIGQYKEEKTPNTASRLLCIFALLHIQTISRCLKFAINGWQYINGGESSKNKIEANIFLYTVHKKCGSEDQRILTFFTNKLN